MDDDRVMHGMGIDDSYRVERILAEHRGFKTELVTLDGAGPFVRKKIPLDRVNRGVWAALPSCGCLRLPQLVATYELPDAFAVVCSYVPGETLSTRVRQQGALSTREAVRIAHDLCEAAGALHAQGIVHCDIAPSNIVLAADGAHLIDLGIARMVSDPVPAQAEGLGTRGFASPEQLFDRPDARSDVYAIGRILGFIVTGARPDDEGYAFSLADTAAVPPALCAIIERASAYERGERYASAAELMRALDGLELEERARRDPATASVVPAPSSSADSAPAPAGARGRHSNAARDRRIIKFTLLALAVVMALVAAGIIVWETVRPGEPETPQEGASSAATSSKRGIGALGTGNDSAAQDSGTGAYVSPGDGGTVTTAGDDFDESIEIVDSWWQQPSTGLFAYAVGIRNTTDDTVFEFPSIYVTAYDADGGRINRTEQVLMELAPGQTTYFSGVAGLDGNEPARVEFEVGESSYGSSTRRGTANPSTFEASNVSAADDNFGGVAVTGDFTTTHIGIDASISAGTAVTIVFRDADGAIVCAGTTFADLPGEGESSTFSLDLFPAPPEYDRVEVHIIPW